MPDKVAIDSHVIPNAILQLVRENGQYAVVKFQRGSDSAVVAREQHRFTEPLMCKTCDSGFSHIEDYARRELRRWMNWGESGRVVPSQVRVDYHKFKLFCLLMAWRIALAGRIFSNVVLPWPITERLRSALQAKDPGNQGFCPIQISVESSGQPEGGFLMPQAREICEWNAVALAWTGFGGSVLMLLSPQEIQLDGHVSRMFLNSNGVLPLTVEDSLKNAGLRLLGKSIREATWRV